jgi:hypothetical protein
LIPGIKEVADSFRISYEVALHALDMVLQEPAFQKAAGTVGAITAAEAIQLFHTSGLKLSPQDWYSLKRLILHHLVIHFTNLAAKKNYDYWIHTQGHIVIGRIERITFNEKLIVAVSKENYGGVNETIYARCPKENQSPRERPNEIIGTYKKFICEKVSLQNRNETLILKLILSRTSKMLPELLLKYILSTTYVSDTNIKCTHRLPGKLTIIEASRGIDKEYLRPVMDEINEGIKVIVK